MTKMKKIGEKISKIKGTSSEIEREVREKTFSYVVTGFSVVAGLAWNDAIKIFIETYFPNPGNSIKAKFLYAVLITTVVVVISLYLSKIFRLEKSSSPKEEKK
jgi:hypothetical protein